MKRLTAVFTARAGYIVIILIATLTALDPRFDAERVMRRLHRAFDVQFMARDVVDGLRNIALFAGWGAVWMVTAPGKRLLRDVLNAMLTGALLSIVVESMQLLSRRRNASILDVLTNTGGAFAGAVAILVMAWAIHTRRGARSYVGIPTFVFAGAYLAAAALESLVPLFRPDRFVGMSGGPLGRLLFGISVFDWGSFANLPLFDFVLFLPVGMFGVAALAERGIDYMKAARMATLLGAAVFVLVELARGAVSFPISGGAALVHIASVAAGAFIAAYAMPTFTQRYRGAARPRVLLIAYSAWLVLWTWRPFIPEVSLTALAAEFAADRWIPLAALAQRMDLFSVVDVVRQFFLLIPVGALLAVWPVQRHGWLRGPLPGVYIITALELGQIFVAGRDFDVTDVIIGVAGVIIGYVIVKRSGYETYGTMVKEDRPSGLP